LAWWAATEFPKSLYRFREAENTVDILRYWHGAQREPDVRSLD